MPPTMQLPPRRAMLGLGRVVAVAWIPLGTLHWTFTAPWVAPSREPGQHHHGAGCSMQRDGRRSPSAPGIGHLAPEKRAKHGPAMRRPVHRRIALLDQGSAKQTEECVLPQTATLPTLVVSLVKNVVGAGVLALPACVAAYSDSPRALVPAILMVLAMGCASAYTFALLARACEMTGGRTYREAWARAVGADTAWLVSLVSMGKAGIGCLMCSMILADAGSALAVALGAPAVLSSRTGALLALTCFVLVPLCFLETLSVLKYTSFAGICGMLYTITVMGLRWLDGSYLPGGRFHELIAVGRRPAIDVHGGSFLQLKSYLLVSCLATAFVAHYNAPKYYRELENPSLPRFYRLVAIGFGGSALVFTLTMSLGFLTFGGNSAGFILNNYATTDGLMSVARAAITFSILCTYPLLFSALREGALELAAPALERFGEGCQASRATSQRATVVLISCITAVALVLRNLGRVAGISGGLFASSVMYIFPAIVFLAATKKQLEASLHTPAATGIRRERIACRCLLGFGSMLAFVSTASAIA